MKYILFVCAILLLFTACTVEEQTTQQVEPLYQTVTLEVAQKQIEKEPLCYIPPGKTPEELGLKKITTQ